MANEQNRKLIVAKHFREIMLAMGLDLKHDSLKDTPMRVAKMLVDEQCAALFTDPPKITSFKNEGYDQMLVEGNISFTSLCAHHFLPFSGKCSIGYIPGKKVIGLSKFIRVVQYFSAKPQIQEQLTRDIAQYLQLHAQTKNVAVVIKASHSCCGLRGAKDLGALTTTSFIGGVFEEQAVREEFLNFIR